MNETNSKKMWSVFEKVLRDLEFSSNQIDAIRNELEVVAKVEITTALLELLSPEEKIQLQTITSGAEEKELRNIIQEFLLVKISKERISKEMSVVTQNLLKDYVLNVFNTVNDNGKKKIIERYVEQLS